MIYIHNLEFVIYSHELRHDAQMTFYNMTKHFTETGSKYVIPLYLSLS